MKYLLKLALASVIFIVYSCSNTSEPQNNRQRIDLRSSDTLPSTTDSIGKQKLIVAVSAMISPKETFKYYEDLFNYISNKIDYEVEFKQRRTYQEVNALLAHNEVDLAFICSGAYVIEKENSNIEILAVPVCDGKPLYQAYIIVSDDSGIEKYDDLQGRSFAFTDPLSNTGKLYAEKRCKELGFRSQDFFSDILYSNAHDISMQLVAKNVVDGATIDGLIYDFIQGSYPSKVENLKVIEKSEFYGIQPVVVPAGIEPGFKAELLAIFLSLHNDSLGKQILDNLFIDQFIEGDDQDYNSIRACNEFVSDENTH